MLVDLTDDELLLIHKAIDSKYYDLLVDMLDYDIDNEEEQKEYKALLKKIDGIEKKVKELR